ncbi:MAG: 3-dehydroquinate synthase [Ginsengibacter sp.]
MINSAIQYKFSTKVVDCFFDADLGNLETIVQKQHAILITDENVYEAHKGKFSGWKLIIVKPGEQHKNQETVNQIISQLIDLQADRQTYIVGIGGGVVTDITGFVASVYMRGVKFGFVPTSILAMVDASIGGKNGIDVGVYKNLVGVINHPEFILYDYTLLETLPDSEWINGFAEIIKHACIKDKSMFEFLKHHSLMKFQSSVEMTGNLIKQNIDIKYNVVANDEFEMGERKLLNFGHTIGHAIENTSKLSHGNAISIGIVAACNISERINNFDSAEKKEVIDLLQKYQLPVSFNFDKQKTWDVLQHDKKKAGSNISFVVLDQIGKASVQSIQMEKFQEIFKNIL